MLNLTAGNVDGVLPASKTEFHAAENQFKQAETALATLTAETQTLATDNQQLRLTVTGLVNKVNSLTPVRRMHCWNVCAIVDPVPSGLGRQYGCAICTCNRVLTEQMDCRA